MPSSPRVLLNFTRYLKVELQDPTHGARYREVFSALQERLSATPFTRKSADEAIGRGDDSGTSAGSALQGEKEQRTGPLMAIMDSVSKLGSSRRHSEHLPDDNHQWRNLSATTSWDILVAQDSFIAGIMDCKLSHFLLTRVGRLRNLRLCYFLFLPLTLFRSNAES